MRRTALRAGLHAPCPDHCEGELCEFWGNCSSPGVHAPWADLQPREEFPQSLQSIPTRILEAPRDARSTELFSSPPCRPLAVLPFAQLQMPAPEMDRISDRADRCRRPFSAFSASSALSALLLLRSLALKRCYRRPARPHSYPPTPRCSTAKASAGSDQESMMVRPASFARACRPRQLYL